MDFEFECQFAYITSDGEQQTAASSVSGPTVTAAVAAAAAAAAGGAPSVGNEAKRLKQE